ncbi:MAG: B12-binding domain-containing radical SAM protein [Negativicutes bacterium]|nr:B12-binding domain-containing radical SAM protein [Negativicutes bacterium]
MQVVLATLNAKFIHSSLALRYLKQYCQAAHPAITIKEYTINNEGLYILGDIFQARPDVLGLVCYIWNREAVLALAALVKKVLPGTAIVLGGPEVTYDAAAVLQENPAVDFVIQGEGEEAFAALLGVLSVGRPVEGIAGVAFRREGESVASEPQVVARLARLPFPYDDDMAELKDKIIYYESSRGCPFACSYCLSSTTRGVRFFDTDRVLAELAFFISHDVRQVKFVDRTFNARREHYWPILRFLAAADCRTNFHFEIAADRLDDDIVEFLATAPIGRFQFEIGVQSTHDATLQAINRKNDWPRLTRHVRALRAAGNIHLHLDLIVGLPFENYQQFGQSFNTVYQLQPHMLQLGFLKMLKGSAIREQVAIHGYVFMDDAPYEVLANHYLTYAEIRRLKIMEELFNQLYNSGRFGATLAWLVSGYGGEAFLLYDALTTYWEERGLHRVAHSAKALYRYIADFSAAVRPESKETCMAFLRFDALMSEQGTTRPAFLPWSEGQWADQKSSFWRDEALVRRYLPDYRFTTWRDINNKYHIEVFPFDLPGYLTQPGEMRPEATAVMFSYSDRGVEYQMVAVTDFWPGKG